MHELIGLMLKGMYLWPIGLVVSLVWGAGTDRVRTRIRKSGIHIVGASLGLAVGVALVGVFGSVIMIPRMTGSVAPSGMQIHMLPYYINAFAAIGAYAWLLTRESVYFKRKPHECQTCGYDLRGLPGEGTRCPECGEA